MTGLGLGLGLSVAVKWCFVSCLVEKELSVSVINSKVCVSDFQRMQKRKRDSLHWSVNYEPDVVVKRPTKSAGRSVEHTLD